MKRNFPLGRAFARRASSGLVEPNEALEKELSDLISRSRATWPSIQLSDETYVSYLGERNFTGFTDSYSTDLYLSCGCVEGNRRAIDLFEEHFVKDLKSDLSTLRLPASRVDDVRQLLLQKLFLSRGAKHRSIEDYSGSGPLKNWVRAAAFRMALDVEKGYRVRQENEDGAIMDAAGFLNNPELDFIRRCYRAPFSLALTGAFTALSIRERSVLRMHYLSGMTLDQLALVYRVHRATIARWLSSARESVLRRARESLSGQLKLTDAELESLLRVMRSQWTPSVTQLLRQSQER